MKSLKLPYPISANRYWRTYKNRVIRSPEATAYKKAVGYIAMTEKAQLIDGDITIHVILHPKLTNKGIASKTRIDLDNALKVVIDALNGIAYTDDKQVVQILAEVGDAKIDGGLTVLVKKYQNFKIN